MSVSTTPLHVGSLIRRDGQVWTVAELHADRVLVRAGGAASVVSIDELIDDPHTIFADEQPVAGDNCAVLIDDLTRDQQKQWVDRVGVVREVLTGYRSGFGEDPRPGEPRPSFLPGVALATRYQAKAAEIGVSVRTVRRWVDAYQLAGPAALIDRRHTVLRPALAGLDQRWVDTCRRVCEELTFAATHTKKYVLFEVESRLRAEYAEGVVNVPGRTRAYEALDEITSGTNMFHGSAKGRREIADRPKGMYGSLRATRLGEYVILDTNCLDVYAMDRLTRRWVNTELTAAMDVYGRIICGFRLSPISTKSDDVASVLFEVVCPRPVGDPKQLPFIGIPETLLVASNAGEDVSGRAAIPIECVVVDHGKVFMSMHIRTVLDHFGISIQPVRTYKGSDKGPLERWFGTLRVGLLEYLDGYMGPDLYSRGKDAEAGAFYFVDELEAIIRRWIREVYHKRPHGGLVLPADPRLTLSPSAMYDVGIATTGYRRIPTNRDTVYDFLPVAWRRINHYGIEFHGLKYNDDVLYEFIGCASPHTAHEGKYPIRYDPADISRIYFQHPDDGAWHQIEWIHAGELKWPFSLDALTYARRLATQRDPDRFPDDRLALAQLLDRWSRDTTLNRRERKIAVQMLDDSSTSLLRLALDERAAYDNPVKPVFEHMGGLTSDDDHETDRDEPLDPDDLCDDLCDDPDAYYKNATKIVAP
ncbi:helix-turn-helix protein [Rhodococcus sp. OK611]|jgi:transposase InsO family protein|uniref:Mu transposase C-terminal domain-containing protein n=1 Tax=unclassified Rhodococcus (in: high G+C Gram-positive bacteria) TaxID=192944 RepID=UPI000BCCBB3C|nr:MULTISPECIES: Mu transposase C-terminal domain-containing protein [unclassified Rhodococcus (in: high G+C Gram-positive bacteria)]PTR44713.1 helix-turn-helix protein [Rhodococcus sp. OK611]SNX90154.1 Helix-turn-helix domain-containing protein [Rhodococcus sp. OK270]